MSAALTEHLRRRALETGVEHGKLRRQFVYDRMLARVFAGNDDWVLKGATALLARARNSRHTRDIDLARRAGDLAGAVLDLRRAVESDIDDHFRFVVGRIDVGASERPGVGRAKVAVEAFVGVTRFESFNVDVVVGSVMTSQPQPIIPSTVIEFDDLEATTYLLYPVVDHIADKVCATFETYGVGRPSSRARDLVDLVVIARSQTVDAQQLRIAIDAERQHRGLARIEAFAVPASWERLYAREAKSVAGLDKFRKLAEALALARRFLDPVLSGERTVGTWTPTELEWH